MSKEYNPFVSIVIPVYNGVNFMREAIDSALNQTYRNIEVIVVNDGSTDDTEKIALSYGEKIKYISKSNGGVATSLNTAIQNSGGEYISWLSHDDFYYPNKIERQIEEIVKISPEERNKTIIFSHFDINNTITNTRREAPKLENFTTEEPIYTYVMLDVFFSSKLGGCTLLFPRYLFNEIGYFDTEQRTVQDYWLFIKFFKAGIKYRYIPDILVSSRHHKEQDTLKLMPLHLRELNNLYHTAFDLFRKEFQRMPFWQFEYFLNIVKGRTLDKVYAYMISEWANGDWNKDKPIIWLYWENKEGRVTPDAIRLCWKTIVNHNKQDFRIKILTEDDILIYLPNINQNYKLHKEIAHRADYIRFNLLYEYGGIWLDSDTIIFRSLDEIKNKINDYGFVCTGYIHENGKIFPTIGFLASRKHNSICLATIRKIESSINEKLLIGIHQEWDDIGWILSEILNTSSKEFFVFPIYYFSPYKVYTSENRYFEISDENAYDFLQRTNIFSFGQALANSNRSGKFKRLSERELLNNKSLIGSMIKLGYNTNIDLGKQLSSNLYLSSDESKIDYFLKMIELSTEKKLIRNLILRIIFPIGKFFYKTYTNLIKQKRSTI